MFDAAADEPPAGPGGPEEAALERADPRGARPSTTARRLPSRRPDGRRLRRPPPRPRPRPLHRRERHCRTGPSRHRRGPEGGHRRRSRSIEDEERWASFAATAPAGATSTTRPSTATSWPTSLPPTTTSRSAERLGALDTSERLDDEDYLNFDDLELDPRKRGRRGASPWSRRRGSQGRRPTRRAGQSSPLAADPVADAARPAPGGSRRAGRRRRLGDSTSTAATRRPARPTTPRWRADAPGARPPRRPRVASPVRRPSRRRPGGAPSSPPSAHADPSRTGRRHGWRRPRRPTGHRRRRRPRRCRPAGLHGRPGAGDGPRRDRGRPRRLEFFTAPCAGAASGRPRCSGWRPSAALPAGRLLEGRGGLPADPGPRRSSSGCSGTSSASAATARPTANLGVTMLGVV